MTNPAKDICNYLESVVSLGLIVGTNLFIDNLPNAPDLCVAVYAYGGDGPESRYESGVTYDNTRVQTRIRGQIDDYEQAWGLAETIMETLHGLYGETINGTLYVGVWARNAITYIGRDEKGRPEWTINFDTQRKM